MNTVPIPPLRGPSASWGRAQTEAILAGFVRHLGNLVTIKDIEGRFLAANAVAERVYGLSAAALQGRRAEAVLAPAVAVQCTAADAIVLETEEAREIEQRFSLPEGERRFRTLKFPIFDSQHCLVAIGAVGTEVTERRQAADDEIYRAANFDGLTQLPVRALVRDRLAQAFELSQRTHTDVGFVMIELENLTAIVHSLGQDGGDAVVKAIADRLRGCVRQSDTVGRMGPETFCVMAANLHGDEEVQLVADKVLQTVQQPLTVADARIIPRINVGAALGPEDGRDSDALIHAAKLAMEEARRGGALRAHRFQEQMSGQHVRRLRIDSLLSEAIERGEFRIAYQPIVDGRTRAVVGAESLLRWTSAELGDVAPQEFIPISEANGLIKPIGAWVLNQACADLAIWLAAGNGPLTVSVNASVRQLADGCFPNIVAAALSDNGLEPAALKVEITESALADDRETIRQAIENLRRLGVRIALDDFGTGYSSLGYLQHFRFHELKIDRSFIGDLARGTESFRLLESIVRLARSLGLCTVAEGVETEDQLALLGDAGCELIQGYYTGRPMSADDFAAVLARVHAARVA